MTAQVTFDEILRIVNGTIEAHHIKSDGDIEYVLLEMTQMILESLGRSLMKNAVRVLVNGGKTV